MAGKQDMIVQDKSGRRLTHRRAIDPSSILSFTALTRNSAVSDEPRRSGRATKGQHKNLDAAGETPKSSKKATAAAATPASAGPSTSKKSAASKKAAKEEEEDDDEDEGDDDDDDDDDDAGVVRCVCGVESEKGPPDFISCDACSVWQHNLCMDLPLDTTLLPDHYLCEQCKPDDHQELLAAISRGEKPWEDLSLIHI